jgi:hypothetical protein
MLNFYKETIKTKLLEFFMLKVFIPLIQNHTKQI